MSADNAGNHYNEIVALLHQHDLEKLDEAKHTLVALSEALLGEGVAIVRIDYDGMGDSGDITDVNFYKSSEMTESVGVADSKVIGAIADTIEEAGYGLLPAGWEINDGSYGHVCFFPGSGQFVREHHWRIQSEEIEGGEI